MSDDSIYCEPRDANPGDPQDDFDMLVERERRQLEAEVANFTQMRDAGIAGLAGIARKLAAIEAYDAAMSGRAPKRQDALRSDKPRQTRSRRGSVREGILAVLRQCDGMARADLLVHFGFKGNKAGEMSISNALTAMVKAGQIGRQNGVYFAPAREAAAAEAQPYSQAQAAE